MKPEDSRHGTSAGYIAGCRDQCCWRAKQKYDKQRRWELLSTGRYRTRPSVGTIRRIQALQALGWSVPQIAKRSDIHQQHLYNLHRHPSVYTSTAAAVAAAYDEMSMTLPPQTNTGERISASRARNHARRNGWPPPLAWDDIDDPDEQPAGWAYVPANRADMLRDLAEHGVGITDACRRLKLSREALEKWCQRNGLSGVYRQLAAREIGQPNQWTQEVAS